jgi:diaminohydroxyphosphoribosylaminopyrimidine deaminase / 5-amino-6-(5-phosphoribosylamino)uracil reductase
MRALTRDETMIREALRLAAKGRGFTSPNPMVGAVVVQNGQIVGKGYHESVGSPHAELNCLRDAGEKARGATLYVTLEPCNHYGRTPPCTQAIVKAGITRVVAGMRDPNPRVEGGGIDFLRSRGIEVAADILEQECRLLNQAFIKHATTGLPLVTLKAAATLDGRIAARAGDAKWISNEHSRRFVHRLRCELDGILIGIGTALADNPLLTARFPRKRCRQPIRIVLDSRLRLPLSHQLVQTAQQVPVWVACSEQASAEKARQLRAAGVDLLPLPEGPNGIKLQSLLQELGRRNLTSLLVEGGAHVLGAFLEENLADDFYFFYAPKLLGDPRAIPMISGKPKNLLAEALPVFAVRVRQFGDDVMVQGQFRNVLY